jgi:hypothetical protein
MTSTFVRLLFVSSSQLESWGWGGTPRRAEEVGVVVVIVRRRRCKRLLAVFFLNEVGPFIIITPVDDDWENDSARPMLAAARRKIRRSRR